MDFKRFTDSLTTHILTSRFNAETKTANREYKKTHPNVKCIYCTPTPITLRIPYRAKCVVLEMDNDIDEIIGIGLIYNSPFYQRYSVYRTYIDEYTYTSKYWIGPEEFTPKEKFLIEILEELCFRGNSHSKRGTGLTQFPLKFLYRCAPKINITERLLQMFLDRRTPCGVLDTPT